MLDMKDDVALKTLGHDIDYLHTVREKKRALEAKLKEVSEHYEDLEFKLITRMKAEGVTKASGTKGTASTTLLVRPHVIDWPTLEAYIHRNKYYQLFERRVSAAAWQELCEKNKGKPVPGTQPFVKDKLSLTTKG